MKSLNYVTLFFTFITVITSPMIGGVCAFGQSDSTQIKKDSILTDADLELRLQELKAEIMQLQKQIDKYNKKEKPHTKQMITGRIVGGLSLSFLGAGLIITGISEDYDFFSLPLYIGGFGATIPGLIILFYNIDQLNKLKNRERQQSKISFGIQTNGIGIAYKF